mmetsp:Transcript_17007/g.49881  ORF Transcript_17007/g.49881 Transcript_17007/m.49881 type:complete len:272 (-) Transcript_17007:3258-4073(-)
MAFTFLQRRWIGRGPPHGRRGCRGATRGRRRGDRALQPRQLCRPPPRRLGARQLPAREGRVAAGRPRGGCISRVGRQRRRPDVAAPGERGTGLRSHGADGAPAVRSSCTTKAAAAKASPRCDAQACRAGPPILLKVGARSAPCRQVWAQGAHALLACPIGGRAGGSRDNNPSGRRRRPSARGDGGRGLPIRRRIGRACERGAAGGERCARRRGGGACGGGDPRGGPRFVPRFRPRLVPRDCGAGEAAREGTDRLRSRTGQSSPKGLKGGTL